MKISIVIFLLLQFSMTNAQGKLSLYKMKVDDTLAKTIKTNQNDSIILVDLHMTYANASKNQFIKYDSYKDKTIKFLTATFFYRLYKADIKYSFRFSATINFDYQTILDSNYLKHIPKCVLENTNCNFISTESALNISKSDSIPFSNNLEVVLIRKDNTEKFFWYVIARPNVDKSLRVQIKQEQPMQMRLIDTTTGQIISRQHTWESNK